MCTITIKLCPLLKSRTICLVFFDHSLFDLIKVICCCNFMVVYFNLFFRNFKLFTKFIQNILIIGQDPKK
ncbi:hypothetical protein CGS56_01120 [Faecalibacterium prausnitzii]|uniref:Uncharacterized protein n=1 Tax=Faecalibacterium prausnitzii TaxID=853 RepID=A0A2A7ACW9_9FIRM|nr:hypothetical protein CGS56_01120 [Faecalibacterium prausnitzii]